MKVKLLEAASNARVIVDGVDMGEAVAGAEFSGDVVEFRALGVGMDAKPLNDPNAPSGAE